MGWAGVLWEPWAQQRDLAKQPSWQTLALPRPGGVGLLHPFCWASEAGSQVLGLPQGSANGASKDRGLALWGQ